VDRRSLGGGGQGRLASDETEASYHPTFRRVRPGLILGHEPVGVIETLGEGLEEYTVGQRVIVGAITPCGQCFYCLNGAHSQCHGPLGGWRFGNTINGAWAEYLLVPDARANLAVIPDGLTDEAVLMLPDIASTGISGAESGNIRIGDSVAVFAQGPIGLCATLGARLRGASLIVGVVPSPNDVRWHGGSARR
jgi:alcohol dehydrogenase